MRRVFVLVVLATALPLRAASLPSWVGFPPGYTSDAAYEVSEDFGKAEFPQPDDKPAITVEGKHYAAEMRAEPGLDEKATWAKLRPALLSKGWTLVSDQGSKVLRMKNSAHDAWMKLDIFGSDDVRVNVIDVAPQSLKLTLPAPAAKPETVADDADFPYIGRIPGSQLKESEAVNVPMDVSTDSDHEPQLAGTGSIIKNYTVPPGLSVHQYLAAYRDALTAAGWKIVTLSEPSDGSLLAHYARNGRDVWASLHVNAEDIAVRVADAGTAADLAKQLDRLCHIAIYGIHFDFNKATLRSDSEGALQQILALMKGNPALSVELQGHTDDVGGDASNQKLSEARAAAVREWLIAKGVSASRIAARGYGRTHPVAPNTTDEGRARNRRVEIAKSGCKT